MKKNINSYTVLLIIMIFPAIFLSGCKYVSPEQDLIFIETARDSQTVDGYQEYLEQSPNGEYTEEARSALAALGMAFPNAPVYDSDSKEPYPIIIIKKYEVSDMEYMFCYHEWNDYLPHNWGADTIVDAALFVIVENISEYYGSKEYTYNFNTYTVNGYKINTKIEIREARTGKMLFSGVLEGTAPLFPYSLEFSTPFVNGSPATYLDFESWLLIRLTQPEEIILDQVLEEAIRITLEHMGNSVGETLTIDDMEKLSYLKILPAAAKKYYDDLTFTDGSVVIVEEPVSNLEGIQYAKNLVVLELSFNNISDIRQLEGLFELDSIIIDNDTYINNSATINILESRGCQIIRFWVPDSYYNN